MERPSVAAVVKSLLNLRKHSVTPRKMHSVTPRGPANGATVSCCRVGTPVEF
jgi:hypothetical protein